MSIVQKQKLSHVTNDLQKVLYLHSHMKIMPFLYPLLEGPDRGPSNLHFLIFQSIFRDSLYFLPFIYFCTSLFSILYFLGLDFSIVNIFGPLFFIL